MTILPPCSDRAPRERAAASSTTSRGIKSPWRLRSPRRASRCPGQGGRDLRPVHVRPSSVRDPRDPSARNGLLDCLELGAAKLRRNHLLGRGARPTGSRLRRCLLPYWFLGVCCGPAGLGGRGIFCPLPPPPSPLHRAASAPIAAVLPPRVRRRKGVRAPFDRACFFRHLGCSRSGRARRGHLVVQHHQGPLNS